MTNGQFLGSSLQNLRQLVIPFLRFLRRQRLFVPLPVLIELLYIPVRLQRLSHEVDGYQLKKDDYQK